MKLLGRRKVWVFATHRYKLLVFPPHIGSLTLSMLDKNLAEEILKYIFLFFPENRLCTFKENVKAYSLGKVRKISSSCRPRNQPREW